MSKSISPTATVYRAIGKKWWVKNGEVAPDAFFLRPVQNDKPAETMLSMLTEANCSKEICFAGLNDCSGELEIKVESVEEIRLESIEEFRLESVEEFRLEIIDDSEELNIPYHASILNLPQHEGDTFAQAEFLAGELAKRVIRINPRQKF